MLAGKGDTNDGNEQKTCKDQVHEGRIETSENQPDDIKQNGQTSIRSFLGNDSFAKWPDHQTGNLKTLKTPGYTNYGQAKYKAPENIAQGSQEPTKHKPDDITDKIHAMKIMV